MAHFEDIEKLKATRWFNAAVERHDAHVGACRELGVEPEPFQIFAAEVLNTPKDKRDWLLTWEPIVGVGPIMRFAQYETPRVEEMTLGLYHGKRVKK